MSVMNKTLNKDGTPRKTGSGRKKGAKSFVNITLSELEKFCGSATGIPVSRVWLERMGASIDTLTPAPTTAKASALAPEPEAEAEQKIAFTLHRSR